MTQAGIVLGVEDGIATLRLDRPERRNAIDDATRGLMIEALEATAADPAVRALVITGTGSAFCAGGDVRGMQQRLSAPAEEVAINGWRRQGRTHRAVALLHNFPKPTIAAVNGAAAGLGCDVALACDVVIAAESAHFTMSFIARGLIPDGGGMYFLPRRVGLARAKELVFSGRRVGAAEALAIGMIERVVPDTELADAAQAWAKELSAGSPAALALAKSVLDRSLEMSFEAVLAEGAKAQAICYTTAEHRASVAASPSSALPPIPPRPPAGPSATCSATASTARSGRSIRVRRRSPGCVATPTSQACPARPMSASCWSGPIARRRRCATSRRAVPPRPSCWPVATPRAAGRARRARRG